MSAILSADDLNDFITPGVACIKPVETLPTVPEPQQSLEHEVFRDDGPTNGAAGPAQISLTDCLACSGCVTSAEAVLVSLQSHAEVLRALDAAPGIQLLPSTSSSSSLPTVQGLDSCEPLLYVASVSPQTRANLAAACGPSVTEEQAGHMLEHLLSGPGGLRSGGAHNNGFTWVVDTNAARDATLVLGADEVLNQQQQQNGAAKVARPLLTSSCPGWVCYAEKTHPHVLGHLSKVKSPQALTGTLLKTTLSRTLGIPADRIWHVAVMPCFDKKLEASREELMDGAWDPSAAHKGSKGVRDVDCVITSKEVLMLAESRGIDFFSLPKTSPQDTTPRVPFPDTILDQFLFSSSSSRRHPSVAAGSSGGNLHFILQSVLAQNPGATLHTARGRNVDVVEYSITAAGADPTTGAPPLFKAARYYGFRNIQNLVRRLRPARPSRLPGGRPVGSARRGGASGAGAGLDFAYVEVMACPGGCTNGGGQIKVDDDVVVARKRAASGLPAEGDGVVPIAKPGPLEQKAWLAEIDEAYFSGDEDEGVVSANGQNGNGAHKAEDLVDGISPSYVRAALEHWAQITGIEQSKLVYTTFREVVSDVGKSTAPGSKKKGADAAEHVVQLAGKIGGGW